MTASEVQIDNKYTVLRELSRVDNLTLSEVSGPKDEILKLAWFDIETPEQRQDFFIYRDALRALKPAGLVELVAEP